MTAKMSRRVDPFIAYLVVAAKKALHDAGIAEGSDAMCVPVLSFSCAQLTRVKPGARRSKALDVTRCGSLVGSAMGGMHSFAGAVEAMTTQGHRKMNPFCIPFAITNMGSALFAMDVGFMGPNYSISSACASGNFCIQNAADHIRKGDADLMLAGASDAAILPIGMAGFSAARALSRRNDDPATASRPWDVDRDGFVMGEGAGVLVLEELEHARARGAPILAEFLGGSYTCDAHHMTEPHPEGRGVALAISNALASCGLAAERVNYVNAHGTSTPAGDLAEYRAIRATLPGSHVRINSTKSMIGASASESVASEALTRARAGHLLGAAGAVEAVAAVMAIQTGMASDPGQDSCSLSLPSPAAPEPQFEEPRPGGGFEHCGGRQRAEARGAAWQAGSPRRRSVSLLSPPQVDVALSNSFGFGGHNSCVLFSKLQ